MDADDDSSIEGTLRWIRRALLKLPEWPRGHALAVEARRYELAVANWRTVPPVRPQRDAMRDIVRTLYDEVNAAIPGRSKPVPSETSTHAPVMVVDDDDESRETVAMLLASEGYGVWEATDGADALEILGELPTLPSVILLDIMMPRMDGNAFLSAIAQTPRFATLPIVIMSATADQARHAVRRVIRKPFDLDELLAIVREACARS